MVPLDCSTEPAGEGLDEVIEGGLREVDSDRRGLVGVILFIASSRLRMWFVGVQQIIHLW